MFLKPFKVKSSYKLKGSDKKKVRSQILKEFPILSEEDLALVYPVKSDVTTTKVYAHSGESVHIYSVEEDPLFFHLDKETAIYPTVYLLWRVPNLLKTFTTHQAVVPKLMKGADLMLPGICVQGPVQMNSYGKFDKGTLVAVNTTENKSPVAIGRTARDSMDFYMAARQGKGVLMIHVYQDHLWAMGTKKEILQTPHDSPIEVSEEYEGDSDQEESEECEKPEEESDVNIEELKDLAIEVPCESAKSETEAMDELMVHCFLKAWKTTAKKLDLPILCSNFFRLHMVENCPDGCKLDSKKSSYKKLSKFLAEMASRGIIEVKEFPKGVENITSVNREHQSLKTFSFDKLETTIEPKVDPKQPTSCFEDVHLVAGSTLKFFSANGLGKGHPLRKSEIRNIVTNYIKRQNLQRDNLVELDPVLHEAVVNAKEGYKEFLKWDEIFSRLLGKMTSAYMVTHPGQPPYVQKDTSPIIISTAKRTGNKKVTLVNNLTLYGIDVDEFAHKMKVGVAASTSIGPPDSNPVGKPQVTIQGTQVLYVLRLLSDTYKIPSKHINNLAPKPSKKSKK